MPLSPPWSAVGDSFLCAGVAIKVMACMLVLLCMFYLGVTKKREVTLGKAQLGSSLTSCHKERSVVWYTALPLPSMFTF